jgi:hypothetical protein
VSVTVTDTSYMVTPGPDVPNTKMRRRVEVIVRLCHSCLTETSPLVTSGIVPTVMQSTCLANSKNNQTLRI